MADPANSSEIALLLQGKESHIPHSQLGILWYQFRRHKMAVAGLAFLILMFMAAIFAPVIAPYDPTELDPSYAMGKPQPPSSQHWFGTDKMGRDLFSRALYGARISLSVGFMAMGIATLIGLVVGSLAGFYGGVLDNILMRLADIFLSLPTFYLILTANALLTPSIYNVMIIIGLFDWMGVARLVRGEFLRLINTDFIVAARAVGVPNLRMILNHLLINSMAPVIVAATIGIPWAILLESALSFLGLGVPPPFASWGNMLYDGKPYLHLAWWMWVPPGLLISLTVIAFNFVGDGLRDAFDPLERGRG